MEQTATVQTQLADVLHVVSQALLIPVILVLIAFIGYALFCIGSILAERFGERRNYKLEAPRTLKAITDAASAELPNVIEGSGLLNRQKIALLTVYDYRALPGDALIALIRRLVSEEETHYRRIVARNNTAAKVSPMVGLMGTLIPLGPGVAALGQADTAALSSSLLIAFDTTVAGLVVAAICLGIGKLRSTWYDDYMSALDACMAAMLEKIDALRAEGGLEEGEPTSFAADFAKRVSRRKPADASDGHAAGKGAGAAGSGDGLQAPAGNHGAADAMDTGTGTGTGEPYSFPNLGELKWEGGPR